MAFVSTKKAAMILGFSECELCRGYRAGLYPAIRIGEKGGRLRFNPEHVLHVIHKQSERNCDIENTTQTCAIF